MSLVSPNSRVMFCKSCLDTKCRRETDVLSRSAGCCPERRRMECRVTTCLRSVLLVVAQLLMCYIKTVEAAVEDSQEEEEEEEDDWTVLVFRSDVC